MQAAGFSIGGVFLVLRFLTKDMGRMTLSFETSRLIVVELTADFSLPERALLIERVPAIFTQSVVEGLPPYFHGISTSELADIWLDRMLSESQLFLVKLKEQDVIGFLFVHLENDNEAHIGYLLAEEYWGKGLASELLLAFIKEVSIATRWRRIVGGVDRSNIPSINLLKKLGFSEQVGGNDSVVYYEYTLY